MEVIISIINSNRSLLPFFLPDYKRSSADSTCMEVDCGNLGKHSSFIYDDCSTTNDINCWHLIMDLIFSMTFWLSIQFDVYDGFVFENLLWC